MASKVVPWYKKKLVSQVKTDYAYHHTTKQVSQKTAVRKSVSHQQKSSESQATEAMAQPAYTVPAFRERSQDDSTPEYQRVSANVGKGLAVIQEELHRMRMATKAQVDNIAIQREVKERMSKKSDLLDDIGKMPDFLVALRPHTVWEKTPVKLFCTVQGNPRPIVKWYKGGLPVDPLSAPGKYKIENKYGVHSLIISSSPSEGDHPSKLEVSLLDCFPVSFGVEGQSISLACSMVVVPDLPNVPPLVHWYRDDKQLKAGKLAQMFVGGGAARLSLPSLAKDDEGLYTVRIFAKDGTVDHSAYLFVSDAPPSSAGAPGAPMSVKAYDVNSDFVLVAWKPPNTVNEAPITGYFVDRCESGSDTWVQCNDSPVKVCKYPVQGLKLGHTYHFRVRAVNSAGISRPSRKSDQITAIDAAENERLQVIKIHDKYDIVIKDDDLEGDVTLPREPTELHVSEVCRSYVVLSWTPPKPRGRAPLWYVVEKCIAGTEAWQRINTAVKISSPRYAVFDLEEGQKYQFRVYSVNLYGPSEASQPTEPVQKVDKDGKTQHFKVFYQV
ncbi:hypothetical protein WMY93_006457 [Mugilogobius chulae]|uniref:Myomesin 2a n=1 Tax=Mugilogobius chulae TaxID=88201 RepID=A0AAW0PTK8_9GOBI